MRRFYLTGLWEAGGRRVGGELEMRLLVTSRWLSTRDKPCRASRWRVYRLFQILDIQSTGTVSIVFTKFRIVKIVISLE